MHVVEKDDFRSACSSSFSLTNIGIEGELVLRARMTEQHKSNQPKAKCLLCIPEIPIRYRLLYRPQRGRKSRSKSRFDSVVLLSSNGGGIEEEGRSLGASRSAALSSSWLQSLLGPIDEF